MSRFDVDRFDPAPDEEFICCICQGVLDKPMETPCRHVFCRVCIETWLENGENKTCPSCRSAVTPPDLCTVLPILNNLINKLRVHCPHRQNGCQVSWQIESFEPDHDQTCEYRNVSCKYEKCRTQVIAKNSAKHEEKCEYRPYVCKKLCGLTIVAKEKSTHACVPTLKETIDELKKNLVDAQREVETLTERNNQLQAVLDQRDQQSDNEGASDHSAPSSIDLAEWANAVLEPIVDDDDQNSMSSIADFLASSPSDQGSFHNIFDSDRHAESSLTDSMVGFSESSDNQEDEADRGVDWDRLQQRTPPRDERSPTRSPSSRNSDHYSSPPHSPPSPDQSRHSNDYDESYYSVVDSVASTSHESDHDENRRKRRRSAMSSSDSSSSEESYQQSPPRRKRRREASVMYSDEEPQSPVNVVISDQSSESSDSADSTSESFY